MIACNQKKCQWVAYDVEYGNLLVCTAPNVAFSRVDSGRSFMLACSNYGRRFNWNPANPDQGITTTRPEAEGDDGLYPGQIKPQPEYTEEMENRDLQLYVAEAEADLEGLCDT